MISETPLVSSELLDLLVCPISGAKLELDEDRLVCRSSNVAYAIRDGIPILLQS